MHPDIYGYVNGFSNLTYITNQVKKGRLVLRGQVPERCVDLLVEALFYWHPV